jgi:tRNA dimethylallyltransferase
VPDAPGPVLALVGPTASGKSALAIDAAERLGAMGTAVEIVAVDAFTVYRGMDVGTAKPSAADRARVPHHGLDLLDPDAECSAERFQELVRPVVADVLARGAVPLLVGGSGLYFRTVVDPLAFPPTDPAVRTAVARRFGDDPVGAHAALAAVDPDAAARIDPANLRRTVRALEVVELTGRPFSEWRRAWDDHESVYDLRVVGVASEPEALRARIDARVREMVAGGLVDECRALLARWPQLSSTARQAIGYAEALDHLAGRIDADELVATTQVRTRRFAARQRRCFAGDPRVHWAAPQDVIDALVERAQAGSPTT